MLGPVGARFSTALLRWYDREKRDLPWRRRPSAYGTLVSESMLQQTVVATVIPYFERFMARYPDLAALAAAREEEVLALWSGLGYYARARNLHKTACAVVERHAGVLPGDQESLRALPGIGEYTAAAVAAIAYGVPTFALDGNAARVMARLTGDARPIDVPRVRGELRARGQTLVPPRRAGDFAQAVMELGARVCVPAKPRCADCPVASHCAAHGAGIAATLPVRSPRRPKRIVALTCVAAMRAGKVLEDHQVLLVRPARGLLAGTWMLPAAETTDGDPVCRALATVGLRPRGSARPRGEIRHVFTHRDVTARVVEVAAEGAATGDVRWIAPKDCSSIALSSFARKALRLIAG